MIVTVSIALILLGRIVSTRVSWVLGRILLLAEYIKDNLLQNIIFPNLNLPECDVIFLHDVVLILFKLNLTALETDLVIV